MPHANELREGWSADTRKPKVYKYIGDTTIYITQVSDAKAADALVDLFQHLKIQRPLTRESFERIGGRTFTCDTRPVFIPAVV